MSESTRYTALNDSIFTARGEDIPINIAGPEPLSWQAAIDRTRIRLHQYAIASAAGPGRFRRQLERRTGAGRPAAGAGCEFALLLRPPAVVGNPYRTVRAVHRHPARGAQDPGRAPAGVVRGTLDQLGRRPVQGEHPLLPVPAARGVRRGPGRRVGRRAHPALSELRLHNGTVYRWNRPVYDVVDGRPHLRLENRVLPAGPTVIDMLANSAFYYGTLRSLSEAEQPAVDQNEFRCGAS